MEYKYKPTTHGRAVMAACMALEKPLKITRVAFGSGKVDENVNLADVHTLLAYVSDGAVAERRHKNDSLYLTIQYANKAHTDVKMFLLSEFIVYTEDPETGAETDLIYGTLGDYRQPVPAYNGGISPAVFNFPLELVISDEVNVSVSAPAGLVTHDELLRLLDSLAAGAAERQIAIPSTGWAANAEPDNPYPVCLDIASTDITAAMVPMLTVLPQSIAAASCCKLCPVSRTLDGILRVYAMSVPADPVYVSLTLLNTERDVHTGLAGSAATGKVEITIPASGWTADSDTGGAYPLHLDIPNDAIQEAHIPLLTLYPGSLEAAGACGVGPIVRTLPEVLRVYAKTIPSTDLRASLALLSVREDVNVESVPGSGLPAATATTLGGVKVGPGSGLLIDSGGNLKLDAAPKEAVVNLFKGSNG